MALTKHPTSITLDTAAPHADRPSVIELWYGDMTTPDANIKEDILVQSFQPDDTLIGNAAIAKWTKKYITNPPEKWFGLNPSLDVTTCLALDSSTAPVKHFLYWTPTFGPLTLAQAAPYKTDDIFKGAQVLSGHSPKSILVPIKIGDNGFCNSTIMLESVLGSALKIGGWSEYVPSTIKIVLDEKDPASIAAFDTIAYNYDHLRGGANKSVGDKGPKGFPVTAKNYIDYMLTANEWMSKKYPEVKDIDRITAFQVFAVNIFSNYAQAFNDALRNTLKVNAIAPLYGTTPLPEYLGAGFTNLGSPNYRALIPLLATFSAGLSNLAAYQGTTYHGRFSLDHAYEGQKALRIIGYRDGADHVSFPGAEYFHFRTKSLTSRDVSPYSDDGPQYIYDSEQVLFITSHEAGGYSEGAFPTRGNVAAIEIPDYIVPLLK